MHDSEILLIIIKYFVGNFYLKFISFLWHEMRYAEKGGGKGIEIDTSEAES